MRLLATVLMVLAASGCSVTIGGSKAGSSEPTSTVTVTASPSASASGSASVAPTGGVPTTYDDGAALVAKSSVQGGSFGAFVTPSGNIFCSADVPGSAVACELASDGIADPSVCAGGQRTTVGRVELAAGGEPRAVCNTDTIRNGDPLEPLRYGDAVRSTDGAVICASAQNGITCLDTATRTGFFLNRSSYRLLR